jgi:ribose/xylose/arabinose/galactoside ABC-type transport system permease subunit
MNNRRSRILSAIGPLLGLAFVILIFALNPKCPAAFLSFYNAKTIITQTVIIGIGALGMTLVIISGGIDLSVGSQIALATVTTAWGLNRFGGETECGATTALLAAIMGVAACGLCGWLNGFVTSKMNIVPFIVTLVTMQIARGTAKWIAREQTVITPSNWLQNLMLIDPKPEWLVVAPGVWITVLLLVGLLIVLKLTVFGRHVFAIGSNEQTARLCGVNVYSRRVWIYTSCGIFTGIAGVMQYANLGVGDPTAAGGMELDIIAAVVIGGGSLSGGEGSAAGSIVGALIMAVLRNGCNMLGVPKYVQEIIIGVIIVCAVLIDRLRRRRETAQ